MEAALKLKINGHDVDFAGALPLNIGDWKAFDRLGLMKQNESGEVELSAVGPDAVSGVMLRFAQKCENDITMDHIDDVPMADLKRFGEWMASNVRMDEPDPTSPTPSTSSGGRMAGAKAKS